MGRNLSPNHFDVHFAGSSGRVRGPSGGVGKRLRSRRTNSRRSIHLTKYWASARTSCRRPATSTQTAPVCPYTGALGLSASERSVARRASQPLVSNVTSCSQFPSCLPLAGNSRVETIWPFCRSFSRCRGTRDHALAVTLILPVPGSLTTSPAAFGRRSSPRTGAK